MQVRRGISSALSATLLAGLGVGLTSEPAAAATCLDGSMCLWADLNYTGTIYPWIPADQMQTNICIELQSQFAKTTTSAKNTSHRNVVLFENPGCSGRSLIFPPLTNVPDLRVFGFDDTAASVLVP